MQCKQRSAYALETKLFKYVILVMVDKRNF